MTGFEMSLANSMMFNDGQAFEVNVELVDKRTLSDQQRKFIFSLCNEYSDYSGIDREYFRAELMQVTDDLHGFNKPSLSQYTMSEASKLIDNIIYRFLQDDVPLRGDLMHKNEYYFNEKQTYIMCLKRICVVCGQRADLHHVDQVGMRSRKKISHVGMRMLPLCRIHHVEAHNRGNDYMVNKYHLTPIKIDEKLEHFIKKGTLKTWKEEEDE